MGWTQTAGGRYIFEDGANWDVPAGDWTGTFNLRQELSGEQTIIVTNAHTSISEFYPGGKSYPQIFTGEMLGVTSLLRFMGGDTVLENTLRSTGSQNYVGYLDDVTVTVRDGGSLIVRGDKELKIGIAEGSTAPVDAPGTVKVEERGKLTLESGHSNGQIQIGVSAPGALWVQGGTVNVAADGGKLVAGDGYDGYLRLTAGLISFGSSDLQVGYGDGHYGQFHMDGGSIAVSSDNLRSFVVGGGEGSVADAYIARDMNITNRQIRIGPVTDASGARAVLTVDNNAVLSAGNLIFGYESPATPAGNKATVNVKGGATLAVKNVSQVGNGQANLNFDNGTLKLNGNLGALSGRIYPGGAILDMNGTTSSLQPTFRRARGWGLAAVNLTNPGANYVTAPKVTISGGSGSNATAVAILKDDRTLERVVVTCPGEGYRATDTLKIEFNAPIGSGAAATLTLAENTEPTMSIWGDYTLTANIAGAMGWDGPLAILNGYCNLGSVGTLPNVTAINLGGGLFTGREGSAPDNPVNSSSKVIIDNGVTYGNHGLPDNTWGISKRRDPSYRLVNASAASVTNYQGHSELRAKDGYGYLTAYRNKSTDNGGAALHFDRYVRDRGIVWYTPEKSGRNDDTLTLTIGYTDYVSPSATSPVLNGFIDPFNEDLLQLNSEGKVVTVSYRDMDKYASFGADDNIFVRKGSNSYDVASVNSILFTGREQQDQLYFDSTDQAEIRSGMVLSCKKGTASNKNLCRLAAPNASITTRVPGGLVIYEQNTNARPCTASTERRFLMEGPFADPAGGSPMPITLAGPRQLNPSAGALFLMLNANTFSGGLNLNNAGLVMDNDSTLGAAGNGIHVSGFCTMSVYEGSLDVGSRPIEIAAHSALELNVDLVNKNAAGTLAADFSGTGDLIIGHPGAPSKDLFKNALYTFTGDHSAFTGTYYIACAVNAGDHFSPHASIRFAGDANVPGVLRANGSCVLPIGLGPGEVGWLAPSYPGNASSSSYGGYQARGGWSAVGGDLTVNFGGKAEEFRTDAEGAPLVLLLQDSAASGKLTFKNSVDCAGDTFNVNIAGSREATFTGTLRDSGDSVENGLCLHGRGTVAFADKGRVELSRVRSTGAPIHLRKARLAPGGRGRVGTITVGN